MSFDYTLNRREWADAPPRKPLTRFHITERCEDCSTYPEWWGKWCAADQTCWHAESKARHDEVAS